jgi:hypothetical protein
LPHLAAAAAILFASTLAAVGADDWQRVASQADNFVIDFPGPTEFTSSKKASNQSEQRDWDFSPTVFQRRPGALTGKGTAFYHGLIASIARAADCAVRDEHDRTIAGYPGFEVVCDSNGSFDLHQLIDAVIVGDRLYMIVSAGPKGHETSAKARRFRDSFKLLDP